MGPSVLYHCPCLSPSPAPPPPHLPSSSYSFHPLHTLFFCEECDAVRCDRCVAVEVSGYYCPNCLFEVPSASVRAEKNRCARNCFLCPNCRNTLSVVPSDPADIDDGLLSSSGSVNVVGEPPFFLYCNYCRWDSAEVGITFEKPTGLAAQLQKYEDSAPDSLEFERLKDHFEPFLRASSASTTAPAPPHHHAPTPAAAAASAALARDIPGVGKHAYSAVALSRSRSGRSERAGGGSRDEMPEYRARVEVRTAALRGGAGGEADVEFVSGVEEVGRVAALEQRWMSSWAVSLKTSDLKPIRIPLHSKLSKRCPACRHILIKPEQKAQSVRFKIKLVAANYLPAIVVALPHLRTLPDPAKRGPLPRSGEVDGWTDTAGGMHAGKTYAFHLALKNPLYDPIQVRLSVQRVHVAPAPSATTAGGPTEKARRPPFAVSLPTAPFGVAAFAEAWEYEDDEDVFGLDGDDEEFGDAGARSRRERDARGRAKAVGVLERRANMTLVGGEVVIGKEARGNIKFNMLVSYTYRSDDPLPSEEPEPASVTPSRSANKPPDTKTFSFYTVVDLGAIVPREEPKEVMMEF